MVFWNSKFLSSFIKVTVLCCWWDPTLVINANICNLRILEFVQVLIHWSWWTVFSHHQHSLYRSLTNQKWAGCPRRQMLKEAFPLTKGETKKNSLNLRSSFCLISPATNMIDSWDIISWKGGIHSFVWSTKTFLYDIRALRCKQIKMG